MKSLPEKFKRDGFNYQILKRTGRIALLSKSMAWMTESYEVVIIQYRLAETIRGKYYPAREVMPRAEQWGKYGFTPFNLELAEIKFDQLTQVTGLGKLDHMRVSLLG